MGVLPSANVLRLPRAARSSFISRKGPPPSRFLKAWARVSSVGSAAALFADVRQLPALPTRTGLSAAPVDARVAALVLALGREGKRQLKFVPKRSPHIAQMAARLQSDEGQAAYRKRKWIAEPPNGWIKSVLGFRQFNMRGLHRVTAQWKLVCAALNLQRMCALQPC